MYIIILDNHIHSENIERVDFANAQSVHDGGGPAVLMTPLQGNSCN